MALGTQKEKKERPMTEEGMIALFMQGVNVISAVKRIGGIEYYLELLDLFYTEGTKKAGLLGELMEQEDIERYTIEAHGLKSAAASIGAEALSKEAAQHEKWGKSKELAPIKENLDSLVCFYCQIMEEIKRVLTQQEYGQFEKTEEVGEQIGEEELLAKLQGILEYMEDFQSKEAAEEVEALLGYSMPDKIHTQLSQIQTLLKTYEDDKAEDLLRELLSEIQ